MKHLIETENSSSLATVPYDRIVLDSTENDVIVKGGGYEYVDLGLPSGLKWAKCNVGAEKETDYGYYFQWGDIVDKSNAECSWSTYKHCNGSEYTLKKYCEDLSYGTVDYKTTLDLEDDAARAHMGGVWRMPTKAEFQELLDNTIHSNQHNGISGYKFISETDESKYIFFPTSGIRSGSAFSEQGWCEFWTSSNDGLSPSKAYMMEAESEFGTDISWKSRCYGLPVRGVFK